MVCFWSPYCLLTTPSSPFPTDLEFTLSWLLDHSDHTTFLCHTSPAVWHWYLTLCLKQQGKIDVDWTLRNSESKYSFSPFKLFNSGILLSPRKAAYHNNSEERREENETHGNFESKRSHCHPTRWPSMGVLITSDLLFMFSFCLLPQSEPPGGLVSWAEISSPHPLFPDKKTEPFLFLSKAQIEIWFHIELAIRLIFFASSIEVGLVSL